MAIDPGCNAKEPYIGDGVKTDFLYHFTIIEDTDLRVAVWDEDTTEYNDVTNWTKPDSTPLVRFDTPPPAGQEFIVYRMTDIDPMKAIFHPGHPVKAGDLNDNFEQLQNAIEDNRCYIETVTDAADDKYWRKADETIYSDDEWIADDEHVASTGAIKGFVAANPTVHVGANPPSNPIQGDLWWSTEVANLFIWYEDGDSSQWVDASITDLDTSDLERLISNLQDQLNQLDLDKVDKVKGITEAQQRAGQWLSDDVHFAYTGALEARYDVVFIRDTDKAPNENTGEVIQPGKLMVTSDNNLYIWSGDQWFQPIAGSSGGGVPDNNHTQISTTNPITQSYNSSTNTYSLNFEIDSLELAPSTRRIRR